MTADPAARAARLCEAVSSHAIAEPYPATYRMCREDAHISDSEMIFQSTRRPRPGGLRRSGLHSGDRFTVRAQESHIGGKGTSGTVTT